MTVLSPATLQMRIRLVYMVTRCKRGLAYVLHAVYKAAREQSGPAVPLQCAFEPAVLPLPVNKHNVALLEFQLSLALGRIGYHHPVPGEDSQRHTQRLILTATMTT